MKRSHSTIMKLLLAITFTGLSACHNGWNSDPLLSQNANIKNAVPQGTDQKGTPPLRDVMLIDVDPLYTVVEGSSLTINIGSRLLHDDFEPRGLAIDGLEDIFPGAMFDPSTGVFFIEDTSALIPSGQIMVTKVIPVDLYAEYAGVEQKVTKEFVIQILKGSTQQPVIESIENVPMKITEGETANFKITVRDEISQQSPLLVISSFDSQTISDRGAQYINYYQRGERDANDPGLWNFEKNTIDLIGEWNVTTSVNRLRFRVEVYNEYGVRSLSLVRSFQVYTRASKPEFFVPANMQFRVGETASYQITAVDTRGEGRVTAEFVNSCSALVGEHSCRCETLSSSDKPGHAVCEIRWTPEAPGKRRLMVMANNNVEEKSGHPVESRLQTLELNVLPSANPPAEDPQTHSKGNL